MKKRKNQRAEPESAEAPAVMEDSVTSAGPDDGSISDDDGPPEADASSISPPLEMPPPLEPMEAEPALITLTDYVEGALPVPGDDDVTNRIRVSSPDDTAVDLGEDFQISVGVDVSATFSLAQDATSEGPPPGDGEGAAISADVTDASDVLPAVDGSRLESILESLLFAADRPLTLGELKRLLGERDGKRVTEALDNLGARRAESGIQLLSVAGGWQLRTHPGNGAWVAKLVAGRPTRLSRAMMETLAIVAYRQPITRPEIDEIRGVDCGPVLRTLLDRSLVRVIGKKEEVGRPMLYGTTPEFLKIFSLRDLAELPTLREFHELGADDRAKVDATTAAGDVPVAMDPGEAGPPSGVSGASGLAPPAVGLPDVDPDEEDSLIEALERAAEAAGRASRLVTDPESVADDAGAVAASTSSESGDR